MTVMNDDRRSDHFRVNLRQGLFGFISRPPRLFGCGDRQHARPLRRDDSLPQCSDTALGGWQNRAMPCGVKITEPRGRIITHLGESLIDEAEAFEELGDVLQASPTLKIEQPERHDWRLAKRYLGMGEPEEHFDHRWRLSNSIEKVRCLSFRAGNQARRRCSRCRPRTESGRNLLLEPEANRSRGVLNLLGVKHYAGHR
ncbi:hypothetical protein AB7M49_001169 [Bradyrhizobium elkanii]